MAYKKPSLIKRDEDVLVPGFDFSKADFEDLIDNFTPKDDIPILLSCSVGDLDKFCYQLYSMKFSDTYDSLLKLAQLYMRKSVGLLAKSGNQTALKLIAESSGVFGNSQANSGITIVANIPMVPSDVELIGGDEE